MKTIGQRTATLFALLLFVLPVQAQDAVIRAGTVIFAEDGSLLADQKITVVNGRIAAIADWSGSVDDSIIDLSDRYVMTGLFDAHSHMALTVDKSTDGGNYYVTGLINSTPYRAVQGVANARHMLESGFTTIRDIGNSGNYGDVAIKKGIDEGFIPGPYMETAGRIIAPFGAQFFLQPEKPGLGEPEYFFADGPVEVMKAVRQNLHFGATFVKIVVDDQRYIYSVEEIEAAVNEAERAGTYVSAHCWTEQGVRNAIEAGVRAIEHGPDMPDDVLQMAKDAGIFLVGTEFTTAGLAWADPAADLTAFEAEHQQFVDRLRRAYAMDLKIVYGSDAVFYDPDHGRAYESLDVLHSWREAGVSNADQLKAMTVTAADLMGLSGERGSLVTGFRADIIAMPANPLDDTNALYDIDFVMKDGTVYTHPGSH